MVQFPAPLFEIATVLSFSVRTSAQYWGVVERKHPEIVGRLDEVEHCLTVPDQVRRSKQDPAVYLFYRTSGPYHLCVVTKRLDGGGFIVTCYLTDAIKEGIQIWPTSE